MAQDASAAQGATDAAGNAALQAQLANIHVTDANGKEVPLSAANAAGVQCPCKVSIDAATVPAAPLPSLSTPFEGLVFVALLVPLVLATVFGAVVLFYMLGSPDNRHKTVDKLAQLLSEGDTSKMSLSRVQALLFTYVITFGSLLIIARTGQFPATIPDGLAILSGGGLATFVVSKAIQGSTNQGPTSPSATASAQDQAPKKAG